MATVVGIAGGTGSGKTTIVREILRVLGPQRVSVIEHDSYYRDQRDVPPEDRAGVNYDHPEALETALLVEHLLALRAGRSVDVPVYDFSNHVRCSETVVAHPNPVILVEGILVLAEPSVRALLDIGVFLDADSDLRLMRRLIRDTTERSRSMEAVLAQYEQRVRPMHHEFVEPSRAWAQLIIPGDGENRMAVNKLVSQIRSLTEGS